jgi:hypothetical protein
VGTEPTSVLDTRRSPSPPTSTSTLSSSLGHGGGGSTDTTTTTNTNGVAAAASATAASASVENPPHHAGVDIGEKCGLRMEDWEGVLSESPPGHEQSILRLIMGDIEDPSMGFNNIEFNAGFGIVDQATSFGLEPISAANSVPNIDPSLPLPSPDFPFGNARFGSVSTPNPHTNPLFSVPASNLLPGVFHQQQLQAMEAVDEKPQIFNPQMIINQNQAQYAQNPAMFMPLAYAQLQEHHLLSPPPAKRLNPSAIGSNYQVPPSGPDIIFRRQPSQMLPQQQRPMMAAAKQKMASDELASQQQQQQQHLFQQAIVDQILKAAELIETGNSILAQGYWRGSITSSLQSVSLSKGLLPISRRPCNFSSI